MSKLLTINFIAENDDINLTPKKGTLGAAGYDIKSAEDVIVPYNRIKKISTGISVEIPKGYMGVLLGRSSTFIKGVICNTGIIDSDYRGIVQLALLNLKTDKTDFIINKYDRIGQLIIVPIENQFIFNISKELTTTTRGDGGFGSTGMK